MADSYRPAQVAALVMLLVRNSKGGTTYSSFDEQFNAIQAMSGTANDELKRAILAIKNFWMGIDPNTGQPDPVRQKDNRTKLGIAHGAIKDALDKMALVKEWGGCRYVEQELIEAISDIET